MIIKSWLKMFKYFVNNVFNMYWFARGEEAQACASAHVPWHIHVWRSEDNLCQLLVPFCYVGPRTEFRSLGLVSKHLYPLRHLVGLGLYLNFTSLLSWKFIVQLKILIKNEMKFLLTKPKASEQSIKIRSSFLGNTESSYKLVLFEIPIDGSWKQGSDIKSQTLLLFCSNTVVSFIKTGSLCTADSYTVLCLGFFSTVYIILQVLRNYAVKIFHVFTFTNTMYSYFGERGWLLGHKFFNNNSRIFK